MKGLRLGSGVALPYGPSEVSSVLEGFPDPCPTFLVFVEEHLAGEEVVDSWDLRQGRPPAADRTALSWHDPCFPYRLTHRPQDSTVVLLFLSTS